MKKVLAVCMAACFGVLFALQARAALTLDGAVSNIEWAGQPCTNLIPLGSNSMCGITDATLYWSINAPGDSVTFGLMAHAEGALPGSPVGMVLQVGGQQIALWQNALGSSASEALYSLRAAAQFPDAQGSYFTLELELGCKTPAAFAALEQLIVRLYDPQGMPSKELSLSIAPAEPAPAATTTEKTTTTKASTTAKTTTAKTTTVKTTTTKTTTTKVTTTKATTTKTTAAKTTVKSSDTAAVTTTAAPWTFAASAAQTAAPAASAQGKYSVNTTWYTVLLTETTAETAAELSWSFAQYSEQVQLAQAMPVEEQQSIAIPAAQNAVLLYAMAALLVVLAVVLLLFWRKGHKA